MGIREKGYYRWEGELNAKGFTWFPIFLRGIKHAFRKKYAKALFGFAGMPFLVFLVALYVSTKPELKMLSRLVRLLQNDAEFFNVFYSNGLLTFIFLVLCIFIGAELISGDYKSNAFPLYFSRPLNPRDYIMGKFSVLLFYLLLFSLVPGVLLVIFKLLFTGAFSFDIGLFGALIVYPLFVALFFTSFTLLVSSLTANRKFVAAAIFLVYVFSNAIAEILRAIFKDPVFELASIEKNIQQTGAWLFGVDPPISIPAVYSALILCLSTGLMVGVIFRKIKRAEAQIENGG